MRHSCVLLLLPASSTALVAAAPARSVRCDSLLRTLFVEPPAVLPAAVADACSSTVEWNDMDLSEPVRGPSAVQELLESKFPPGSLLKVEKLADGARSGGFTWHREAEGETGSGLRGVTYVELDEEGKISYVQEGNEPLFKLDKLLEALLVAANKNKDESAAKPPVTYTRASPTTAEGIVRYLWEVAYPGGATPTEALEFFADDILYEDFNYREPFVGLQAVSAYIGLLEVFPNFVFIPERISEGEVGCCLTWRCEVNGEPGPSGISFNEVNADGKICFARDIPAPGIKPPPFATLAARVAPKLRTFRSRAPLPSMALGADAPPSALETVTTRPARAALAAAWVLFSAYVAAGSPGEFLDPADTQLITGAIDDPASLNPIFFFVFNALGLIPAVNLALLLPGSREQRPLPTLPFTLFSFAAGYGGIGPYLALRQPRFEPVARAELGPFARYVTESRLYGAGLVAGALALYAGLLGISDGAAAGAAFAQLFESSKLVHVSTIDLAVLTLFLFEPIKEDMARRGWWDEASPSQQQLARLVAFCAVPVVGPAAYVLLRPALPE